MKAPFSPVDEAMDRGLLGTISQDSAGVGHARPTPALLNPGGGKRLRMEFSQGRRFGYHRLKQSPGSSRRRALIRRLRLFSSSRACRMEIATLVGVLDQPHVAADHLHGWGLRDLGQAQRTLVELADTGLTLDLLAGLCSQLAEHLPQMPDPDAALEGFRRYLFAVRSPIALAGLLARDAS